MQQYSRGILEICTAKSYRKVDCRIIKYLFFSLTVFCVSVNRFNKNSPFSTKPYVIGSG